MRVKKVEVSLLGGRIDDAKLIGLGMVTPWPASNFTLPEGKICLEIVPNCVIEFCDDDNSVGFYDADRLIFTASLVAKYQNNGFTVFETKTDQLSVKFFAL